MIIELLSPIIANGTTIGPSSYAPWLPFYFFIPVIALMGLIASFLTGNIFWGINLIVSSLIALLPTWGLWRAFNLEPSAVFIVWVISTAFSMWSQYFMIRERKILIMQIKAGQKHSHTVHDFDDYEDYKTHIKLAHPDIWRAHFSEEEDPKNAD